MASELPAERRRRILEWLKVQDVISIDMLVERLGVSAMTVHRDLDRLASDGLVEKVHGGVALMPESASSGSGSALCQMCHKAASPHTAFFVHTAEGAALTACCPHCGLMMFHHQPEGATALATDFLHGHRVNARQAIYLLEPTLQLCCVPTVLAFASEGEAQRFQRGFEGSLLNFGEASGYLLGLHRSG